MNFYETKYKEIQNINDLIYSKMNNGNILLHYNYKIKNQSSEKHRWKRIVEIKVYNQKLELIYENQLHNFKKFSCFPCYEFFELMDGNMIYNTKYSIYIINNILKSKKIFILQNIEKEELFKVRELKNNDILLFNEQTIELYKKEEEKYVKYHDINVGRRIKDCTSVNKKTIAILKNYQGKGKVIFYNLNNKQITFVFSENKGEIYSFINLKNNPNLFVVSCVNQILLFDMKKFKIIQIINKKKRYILDKENKEYINSLSSQSYYPQIFELDDGSILIKESCSNENGMFVIDIIDRYKIENNLLKNYYSSNGQLDSCKFIIPFNNEIIGCYYGISLKFMRVGTKKVNIKLNNKSKNLKDLLK